MHYSCVDKHVFWPFNSNFLGWVMFDYFIALSGVKQGGVVSPTFFCIYIDDLLVSSSKTGVAGYVAGNFVGAIAYADDIVLISPTPLGMRKLFFNAIHMQMSLIFYLM